MPTANSTEAHPNDHAVNPTTPRTRVAAHVAEPLPQDHPANALPPRNPTDHRSPITDQADAANRAGSANEAVPGDPPAPGKLDRRRFMSAMTALGLGTGVFPGVLWARIQERREITAAMIADAEAVAGIELEPEWRERIADGLNDYAEGYAELREVEITNAVPPALQFDPVWRWGAPSAEQRAVRFSELPARRPADVEALAFASVLELATLLRTRQVSSLELTRMYLDRLQRHGPRLQAVITLTEERALAQARRADEEIAAGRYRGPLHGIPWGAKDLLAVRGYPTTWGAEPYRTQVIDDDATVVRRLDEAGAVLVAKLTLGALAQGDDWFGGETRNPWNLEEGSRGSSAGSAACTAAGLVAFAIGSETQGSIVSPATRCGVTGLRPTFGRVSRAGAMALSWSMDKLGPICRTVEDCAVVLDAIRGPDGRDPTVRDVAFNWSPELDVRSLRVGYLRSAFARDHDTKPTDDAALAAVRALGVDPVPVELPDYPTTPLRPIIRAESAAAFDELVRTGRVDLIERSARPRALRAARFIPAVEYIQANRVRARVMERLWAAMRDIDVFVTPSYAGSVLLTTNLTGHPTVVLPNGFTEEGTPVSISFVGQLWNDAAALAAARAYQNATDWHTRQPPEFGVGG